MKLLIALSGLHRVNRGAEVAFISLARELVRLGVWVTLVGSGEPRPEEPYDFVKIPSLDRQRFVRFPAFPAFRDETSYEELTFGFGLLARLKPGNFDITMTCAYPFTNWALRRPIFAGTRPAHVFVTQNGDWPAYAANAEYRFFGCDGLVCTNPDYLERNSRRWNSALIPNGVNCRLFAPGPSQRQRFGLPEDRPVILLVSALIASKRVAEAIDAIAALPGPFLVVAGDGPERDKVEGRAAERLPGRFKRLTVKQEDMVHLYRSADCLLHFSLEEPFGNIFLEAMSCGLPVVAHDSLRLRWLLGELDFLTDTQSVSQTARAISSAIATGKLNGQKRIERAKSFDWPVVGQKYLGFLESVVRNRKSRV